MNPLPYSMFLLAWLVCSVVFAIFWWQQVRTSNANWVDVAWAASIGVLAIVFALFGTADAVTRVLLALLPGIWAMRLAAHIFRRNRHAAEDSRYAYLRAHWTDHTRIKFFCFYQAQALTVMAFSFQFFALAHVPTSASGWRIGLALGVWLIAVLGEAAADRQLTVWRMAPSNHGKTCRAGLWRYSRHPNYFFEWLHWWSYVPLAAGTEWWWVPLLTQGLMLLTLLFGTGIPHAERQALMRRGDDYRDYQRTTSSFFPWWPKSAAP